MDKKHFYFLIVVVFLILPFGSFATSEKQSGLISAPQPTPCVVGTFSRTGNNFWSNVSLQLKNTCGQTIDLQNSTITFNNSVNLNTSFWGKFGVISYPDNKLQITSQPLPTGGFLSTLFIHIPEEDWVNSKLPNGQFITLKYGTETPGYDPNSTKVYLSGPSPQTGEIDLISSTPKPAGVDQTFAIIDITNNGQPIKTVQLPWQGQQQIVGLTPGSYVIQPMDVTNILGDVFQGSAQPSAINLGAGQKVTSSISYTAAAQTGTLNIQAPPLPNALSGYPNTPVITLTRTDTGGSVTKTIPWNTITLIGQLAAQKTYRFSTPIITFNGNSCTATFTPTQAVSSQQSPPTVQLSYACIPVNQINATLNVNGLTSSTPSVIVTLTPNNAGAPLTKTIILTNGNGSGTINLTQGIIYNVSATSITGFNLSFNPQPLTAMSNVTETITYQQQQAGGGRVIGYIPGWKQPPSATALANAGYTHALIAFGVFSTSQPGVITPAFDTVTKDYISSLHNAGIKVSLSLGGASSSVPNTSVDFHQVLQLAGNATTFQQTFVQSVKNLISTYGFDGIDIDIEHGLNAGGTFANPSGDIAVLAGIINKLHSDLPNLLISLAPQTANVSATSFFDATWGNYASLIMQTSSALSWVGIQLYNSGCMLGIDQVCYDPNNVSSPNFSVIMATDLLANWPATDASGRATNFQPYISHLTPNQIVLGYPSPNAQGSADATPITPTSTIKRAIQCLRTAVASSNSCGTYVPPQPYGLIGGVFNWEVTFDQSNNFRFATDLKACVSTGVCI